MKHKEEQQSGVSSTHTFMLTREKPASGCLTGNKTSGCLTVRCILFDLISQQLKMKLLLLIWVSIVCIKAWFIFFLCATELDADVFLHKHTHWSLFWLPHTPCYTVINQTTANSWCRTLKRFFLKEYGVLVFILCYSLFTWQLHVLLCRLRFNKENLWRAH